MELPEPAPLSAFETLMWRLEEHDPRLRPTITVVAVFDRSPGYDLVADRMGALALAHPRLRQRVVAGVGRAGFRWEYDPNFALGFHVRRAGAAGEGSTADLLRFVEPLASEGFDHVRPPWQATLVEGMERGGAAMVLKLHHAYTDGVGLAELAGALFALHEDAPDQPASPDTLEPLPQTSFGRLWDEVEAELEQFSRIVRGSLPAVAKVLRDALNDPEARVGRTFDMLRSFAALASPSTRPLSPIMRSRSAGAALASVAVPLEAAKSRALGAGASVNDVFVSALLEGLRLYHDKHGCDTPALRVGIPINMRVAEPGWSPAGSELTNDFAPTRIVLPLHAGAADRLRIIHDLVAEQRRQPALGALGAATEVLNRVPGAVALTAAVMWSVDVIASNVTGSPVPLYLGPARLLRLLPFGPRSGAALNVTVVSYDGTLSAGINIDPAAVQDTDALVGCIEQGFESTILFH